MNEYYIWKRKKFEVSNNVQLSILSFTWMILGIVICLLAFQLNIEFPELGKIKYMDSNDSCNQTDIFMNAECLNHQLNKWFFYNLSNIGKELNLEELQSEGGVCSHASKWYYDNINKSMFYAEKVRIQITNDSYHVFTVISGSDGYCLLDQEVINCVELEQ